MDDDLYVCCLECGNTDFIETHRDNGDIALRCINDECGALINQ